MSIKMIMKAFSKSARSIPFKSFPYSGVSSISGINLKLNNSPCQRQFCTTTSAINERFNRAVETLKTGDKIPVSNEKKLKLYAFYKQALIGTCSTSLSRPSVFSPVERAKFDAWQSLGNISKEEAMTAYSDLIASIIPSNKKNDKATDGKEEVEVDINMNEFLIHQIASPRKTQFNKFKEMKLETINTDCNELGIASVVLNRPKRGNAFDMQMWSDFRSSFAMIESDSSVKVVVLTGSSESSAFSTGMDLEVFKSMGSMTTKESCAGRRSEGLYKLIQYLQDAISMPEKCSVPVIAQISGHCIGGAIDLITACDLRYCTEDSKFSIKETDLAMVADIGTLQRLPKLIGDQRCRELAYTGRTITGIEAKQIGLVLECFKTKEELTNHVSSVAKDIASKSPLAIRGIKKTVTYTRDHSVDDSLEQVKLWNAAHLDSEDLQSAFISIFTKKPPQFRGD